MTDDLLSRIKARLNDLVENALDPQAAAAAAADLAGTHQPSHWHGPVRLTDGLCNACHAKGEPAATWTVTVTTPMTGEKRRQELHCHGIAAPAYCELCGDSNDLVEWPCRPLRRAAAFLGVPIEDVSTPA